MALSIAEARELLGKEAERLSDEDIQRILESLYILADELLELQRKGEL